VGGKRRGAAFCQSPQALKARTGMAVSERYPRVASLRRRRGCARLAGCARSPCGDEVLPPMSPLGAPLLDARTRLRTGSSSSRWKGGTARPMDPTELTQRRWQRFGSSGAAWMWGGGSVRGAPRRSRQSASADAARQHGGGSRAVASRVDRRRTGLASSHWSARSSRTAAVGRVPMRRAAHRAWPFVIRSSMSAPV
jgi:hypothetical protein